MRRRLAAGLAGVFLASIACSKEPSTIPEDAIELFDGHTLDGWVAPDSGAPDRVPWTVEDGVLVGRPGEAGAGGLLRTALAYRAVVLTFEMQIDGAVGAGIVLRAGPGDEGLEVRLDGSGAVEVVLPGSGEVIGRGSAASSAPGNAGWNRVAIRMDPAGELGMEWNGAEVLERRAWAAGKLASNGPLGLRVHGGGREGGAVRFRDLRARELPEFAPDLFDCDDLGRLTPTDVGREAGWRALFDGDSLDAFETLGESRAVVRDGLLCFPGEGGDGDVRTKEDFRDFELRLDFRMSFMCNSGLFLRAARDGSNSAYSGCEIQILDDFNWERVTGKTLEGFQFTGGLYGSLPNEKRGAVRPPGHWNSYEVRYVGSRLAVVLNGEPLYDVDTLTLPGKPFAERAPTGFIGLQRHAPREAGSGDFIAFRNIFVRPLP